MRTVLVSGATGFIGRALCKELVRRENAVRAAVRDSAGSMGEHCAVAKVGDIGPTTEWAAALHGVDTVVHLAARVHVMHEPVNNPLAEFCRVNVEGTLNLAQQAVAAGVGRFVFLSSIGVNGKTTSSGRKFTADDLPAPHDPYSISKYEAEQGLRKLAAETGLEVVIIRPPLVYGADAPGNFGRLLHVLAKRPPLPLGAIHNKRSLVALENLVDLIVTCLHQPRAANQTFLVSDDEDISTTELLRRMGEALGKPARLIPVPTVLLRGGAQLLGKPDLAQRLCDSLQVDIRKTRERLGWMPPVSFDEAIKQAAQRFMKNLHR